MTGLTRSQLVFYLAVAGAVILLGMRSLRPAAPIPGAAASRPARLPARTIRIGRDAAEQPVVHVVGAVRRPGVYRLRDGARIGDAVRRAGGATTRADLAGVNLAARLADGQQIVVPLRIPGGAPSPAGAVGSGAAATGGAGGALGSGAPIDLNTATAEQLDTLDGVGPVTAQKILAWRSAHGAFRSREQLAEIPGIGPKRLAALRPKVRP